jgi:DNA repair protein RecN (Recombination protein N)
MLTALHISQFAIVDRLDIEFAAGLTVVTGETGAGKSIMVDALGLALGDRADAGVVRAGAPRAEVTATFDIGRLAAARDWLAARDLDAGDECILRRSIGSDGRSRAFVNGSPATLADLRALGELLVDIHGQHEHQSLLRRDTHRELVDRYGRLQARAGETAAAWRAFRAKQDALAQLEAALVDRDARRDLLRFQAEEFDRLALREGEYAELEAEQKRLANVDGLRAAAEKALALCWENDDGAARDLLEQARGTLEGNDDEAFARSSELLGSAIIHLEEAADGLRHFLDRLEADPERLAQVERRLSQAFQLARKHRVAPPELVALHARITTELDQLDNSEGHRAQLAAEADALRASWLALAGELGKARRAAAKKLEKEINAQLATLGMAGGRLGIVFEDVAADTAGAHGLENIEFQVSLNAGQPLRALGKVASGGELSRISLAIQVICADQSSTPVLVFDEVDVGIGGGTAEIVGRLLRRLGARSQVLCVTHLAQVAACGHQHLQVEKNTVGGATRSRVTPLDRAARVQEIARMAGGLTVTPEALRHAEAMLVED